MQKGKVYLIGGGVGGKEFLTVQASGLLAQAEVVIADALIDESLRSIIPKSCEWLEVGKRGGKVSFSQPQINQLLLDRCLLHKVVIRLKSGDPWVFGRALQEIEFLSVQGCDWEIVPGISSAIAGPMWAGIPITETDRGNCFIVATGHDLANLPWQSFAEVPTLIFLMGTLHLLEICQKLQTYKSSSTPIAVIRDCGSVLQQVWTGTLAHIELPSESLSPAVIVIGETVKYHSRLGVNRHSVKKTILVTRSVGQSSGFSQSLQELGATTIEMPTLEIVPPSSWKALDRAITTIDRYHWLILTSVNGVENFFQRLHHQQKDSRALHSLKIAVVGRKTSEALQTFGIFPDLVPPNFIAESLVSVFPDPQGQFILFPRVESGGREVLITQLESQGAVVEGISAYESRCPLKISDLALAAIQSRKIDVITFASSKTVVHFVQLLDQVTDREQWRTWIVDSKIASIGPQTSQTCQELLGRVDIEATEFSLPGLTVAIKNHFSLNT